MSEWTSKIHSGELKSMRDSVSEWTSKIYSGELKSMRDSVSEWTSKIDSGQLKSMRDSVSEWTSKSHGDKEAAIGEASSSSRQERRTLIGPSPVGAVSTRGVVGPTIGPSIGPVRPVGW